MGTETTNFEYPKAMYHATEDVRVVQDATGEEALGSEWFANPNEVPKQDSVSAKFGGGITFAKALDSLNDVTAPSPVSWEMPDSGRGESVVAYHSDTTSNPTKKRGPGRPPKVVE
jgi:hypothetical protein